MNSLISEVYAVIIGYMHRGHDKNGYEIVVQCIQIWIVGINLGVGIVTRNGRMDIR